MSSYTDLQGHFDKFNEEMRKAKNASGYTLQEVTDLSGVPHNFTCSINAGTAKQPSLFYSAAMCRLYGLSLDRLMGLSDSVAEQEYIKHIHELELAQSEAEGKIKLLEAEKRQLTKHTGTVRAILSWMAGICSMLVCLLIGYVIFDIQLKNVGLFQSAGVSALAFALIAVIIIAIIVIVYSFKALFKKKREGNNVSTQI